jgi:transposase
MVMLDNLAAHKVAGTRQVISSAMESLLCLPPHFVNLSLVEQMFATLKPLWRNAAAKPKEAPGRPLTIRLTVIRPKSATTTPATADRSTPEIKTTLVF